MRIRPVVAVVVVVFALAGCSSAAQRGAAACPPSRFRSAVPRVIAHAGGEGLGPANTLLAMRRSMAAGADILDADLWMTADGVIVAHHDRDLTATTGESGRIDELTWSELQQRDTRPGWNGASITEPVRIPSLPQILEAFPDVEVSVEIKQTSPSMADALCTVLRDENAFDRVYVSSNFDEAVYAAQAACPQLTITTTYRDVDAMRAAQTSDGPWCAPAPIGQPPYSADRLSATSIAWSHAHGMAVYTWTIDDPVTLRALAEAGVDGVYTRRPDVARAVFDELAGGAGVG